VAISLVAAVWIAFGSEPWELLPFRDERVLGPRVESAWFGIGDFYRLVLPFDSARHAEMHAIVAVAVLGFVFAVAWLVATGRPLGAAAVTVAGVGWPATLLDENAVATGTLALA